MSGKQNSLSFRKKNRLSHFGQVISCICIGAVLSWSWSYSTAHAAHTAPEHFSQSASSSDSIEYLSDTELAEIHGGGWGFVLIFVVVVVVLACKEVGDWFWEREAPEGTQVNTRGGSCSGCCNGCACRNWESRVIKREGSAFQACPTQLNETVADKIVAAGISCTDCHAP